MKKKKVYNIQEDVEMQKLFQEYYLLNDWWQTVKKELEEKKEKKGTYKMIHVENDWYVDVDKYCYVLAKYNGTRLDKDGKEVEVWTDQKYYATLKKALAGYFKIKTKELLSQKDYDIWDAIKMLENKLADVENKIDLILREQEEV